MIALGLMAAALAAGAGGAEAGLRRDLDVALVYGFGDRHAFGGAVEGAVGLEVWETAGATGTLDGGLLAGYQVEPYAITRGVLGGAVSTGASHRLQALVVVGHTLRLSPTRRILLGLQLYGGWTHVWMRGRLTHDARGVSGEYVEDAGTLTSGLILRFGVRLSERLSLLASVMGPFPYAEAAITSYVMPSLGLSLKLP